MSREPSPIAAAASAPVLRAYGVPCTPPAWARGGHAQTLLAHLLPSRAPHPARHPRARRREVALADGDRLVLFELPGTSGVRVHLFHGLSGDVGSDYVRRTAAALGARGHGVWAVNHRGCGAGRGLAARPYHSGRTEDLQAVLAESRAEAPELVHLFVGFSLSGNAGLLYAAQGLAPRLDGLVAVNPPVDLERASLDIGRGPGRVYERRFIARLRREVRERERRGWTLGRYRIPRSMTLVEFDDVFTAPECGFASGRDYYRRCSSGPRLVEVDTPAVIVAAADDPFVDAAVWRVAARSARVHLHLEPTGGHVGYLARAGGRWPGLGWTRWLDGAVVHYVEELARLARG